MTTPNYSGFLSSFLNTSTNTPSNVLDILSLSTKTSSNWTTSTNPNPIQDPSQTGTMGANYFYLGNLLIQYSNVGTSSRPTVNNNTYIAVTFPVPYDASVIPTVLITADGNWAMGVTGTTNTQFVAQVGGGATGNYPNWIAIGTINTP